MVLGLGNSIIYSPVPDSGYGASASWDFDGTDDYINLGNASNIKLTATDTSEGDGLTVSAWIKSSDWSLNAAPYMYIISAYQYHSAGKGWYMAVTGSKLRVSIDTATGTISMISGFRTFAQSDGTEGAAPHFRASGWHHVSFTYDGRFFKMYIDGQLAQSGTNTLDAGSNDNVIEYGSGNGNVDILIGADPGNLSGGVSGTSAATGTQWDGQITEVAMWNKALDVDALDEIYEAVNTGGSVLDLSADSGSYNYSENLVGLWRASEVDGTTAVDTTGNNDGSIKNSLGTVSEVPS